MAECCTHEKIYHDGSEYYLFTWSIPKIGSIINLNVTAGPFKTHEFMYDAVLCASKEKIQFSIKSSSEDMKCSVSMSIGSEKLLFSNTLNAPTRDMSYSHRNGYFYDLVVLSSKHECFQKLKQHPNDTLVLICRIKQPVNTPQSISIDTPGNTTPDSLHNLKTLAAALKNSSISLSKEKVVLRVGEETETVSKAVLCARSPVFARMFQKDKKDQKGNKVTVTDVKMDVVKALVSFLYTGKILQSDFAFLCDLYYASDKYGIADLRQLCVNLLLPQISIENIFRVLKLAFSHDDAQLKLTAMTKFAANIETWVLADGWKNLINEEPEIADEVLKFFDF